MIARNQIQRRSTAIGSCLSIAIVEMASILEEPEMTQLSQSHLKHRAWQADFSSRQVLVITLTTTEVKACFSDLGISTVEKQLFSHCGKTTPCFPHRILIAWLAHPSEGHRGIRCSDVTQLDSTRLNSTIPTARSFA